MSSPLSDPASTFLEIDNAQGDSISKGVVTELRIAKICPLIAQSTFYVNNYLDKGAAHSTKYAFVLCFSGFIFLKSFRHMNSTVLPLTIIYLSVNYFFHVKCKIRTLYHMHMR